MVAASLIIYSVRTYQIQQHTVNVYLDELEEEEEGQQLELLLC